jgi:hypothetical protein
VKLNSVLAAVAIPALVAGMALPAATQQDDVPTVSVRPVGTDRQDPNEGLWFVALLTPGGPPVTLQARLSNRAPVDQRVTTFLADLGFRPNGAPIVIDTPTDVGAWGSVDQPELVVPAQGSAIVSFTLRAPADADPGDHVGAFVVESAPVEVEGAGVGLVKRVATRLYATIPGAATQDITIESVDLTTDSWFFPREITANITLRNTGRIRLQPAVTFGNQDATGPTLLMSRSVERYVATAKVPFWAGLLRYPVKVETTTVASQAGPVRMIRVTKFVFPWHLLVLLAAAVGAFFGLRRVWRRRGSKYAALQSDIRRIERLLSAQATGGAPDDASGGDPEAAILAAIKQARRAGDRETEVKLTEKLDRARGAKTPSDDALAAILREIPAAPPKRRAALIEAAKAFGKQALRDHGDLVEALPEDARVKLVAASKQTKPRSKSTTKRRP